MLNMKMTRWVERVDTTTVRFGNLVGPYIGSDYVYNFPNESLADEFEEMVKGTDEDGMPAVVDPSKWAKYNRRE